MTKPTFLVIGAAKCGTTSVCDLLGTHPNIFMCSPMEPHFFSRLATYPQKSDWYASLFENARSFSALGEGSTSYTHPHRIDFVVPRIRAMLPNCKLVYMVRHPIRRLESDWKMRLREERAPQSITQAVERQASLVTFGLYWKHLSAYRAAFPDDQLLVVFLEDFAVRPYQELSRIFQHIGADPTFAPEDPSRRRNASTSYRKDSIVASAVRRIPGYRQLKRSMPDWIRDLARNALTYEAEPSPDWPPEVLKLVQSYFREDSRCLLEYCGKATSFWSFDEAG